MPRSGQKGWILALCNSSCVQKRQDITSNAWLILLHVVELRYAASYDTSVTFFKVTNIIACKSTLLPQVLVFEQPPRAAGFSLRRGDGHSDAVSSNVNDRVKLRLVQYKQSSGLIAATSSLWSWMIGSAEALHMDTVTAYILRRAIIFWENFKYRWVPPSSSFKILLISW